MEGFVTVTVIIGVLVVVGLFAEVFGADSRPAYADDWARDAAC